MYWLFYIILIMFQNVRCALGGSAEYHWYGVWAHEFPKIIAQVAIIRNVNNKRQPKPRVMIATTRAVLFRVNAVLAETRNKRVAAGRSMPNSISPNWP